MPNLAKKTIVLGVTGGIACYKACELTRLLKKEGANVHVIMTASAREFVTPLSFQALSINPVRTSLFDPGEESLIGHIELADKADLILIAPATANIIGKIANGLCDDLLTTVVCATKAPVVLAPAMNVHMYENPFVQENLGKLKKHGYKFIGPASGSLACGYEGEGRMEEPENILKALKTLK